MKKFRKSSFLLALFLGVCAYVVQAQAGEESKDKSERGGGRKPAIDGPARVDEEEAKRGPASQNDKANDDTDAEAKDSDSAPAEEESTEVSGRGISLETLRSYQSTGSQLGTCLRNEGSSNRVTITGLIPARCQANAQLTTGYDDREGKKFHYIVLDLPACRGDQLNKRARDRMVPLGTISGFSNSIDLSRAHEGDGHVNVKLRNYAAGDPTDPLSNALDSDPLTNTCGGNNSVMSIKSQQTTAEENRVQTCRRLSEEFQRSCTDNIQDDIDRLGRELHRANCLSDGTQSVETSIDEILQNIQRGEDAAKREEALAGIGSARSAEDARDALEECHELSSDDTAACDQKYIEKRFALIQAKIDEVANLQGAEDSSADEPQQGGSVWSRSRSRGSSTTNVLAATDAIAREVGQFLSELQDSVHGDDPNIDETLARAAILNTASDEAKTIEYCYRNLTILNLNIAKSAQSARNLALRDRALDKAMGFSRTTRNLGTDAGYRISSILTDRDIIAGRGSDPNNPCSNSESFACQCAQDFRGDGYGAARCTQHLAKLNRNYTNEFSRQALPIARRDEEARREYDNVIAEDRARWGTVLDPRTVGSIAVQMGMQGNATGTGIFAMPPGVNGNMVGGPPSFAQGQQGFQQQGMPSWANGLQPCGIMGPGCVQGPNGIYYYMPQQAGSYSPQAYQQYGSPQGIGWMGGGMTNGYNAYGGGGYNGYGGPTVGGPPRGPATVMPTNYGTPNYGTPNYGPGGGYFGVQGGFGF